MASITIHGHRILTYEHEIFRQTYWTELSNRIIEKYGKNEFVDNENVEAILLDCFEYLTSKFKDLISEEVYLSFYNHIFYLHEESWNFLAKTREGYDFGPIQENDFSRYRRILKLILEQGCDTNLQWGNALTDLEVRRIEQKIQALYYIGTWIYTFADYISYNKMVPSAKKINFNDESQLGVYWKEPFEFVYDNLFPNLEQDYIRAIVEENATTQLIEAIDSCFRVKFQTAIDIIFAVKRNFSTSLTQTIEPYVLPANLAHIAQITEEVAKCFYDGLTLSRANKMSLEDTVLKPYSTERYMYRPILVYNVNGVDRALVGEGKIQETMYVLATNAISWNTIPLEWKQNVAIVKYMSRKGNTHDSLLEDVIQEIFLKLKMPFVRNIKSFKRVGADNLNMDKEAGEIDFIVIDELNNVIYVGDSKYNKARYEAVGYRTDYTNFLGKYESQLSKKLKWVDDNRDIVEGHFNIIYKNKELTLSDYSVEGLFFINTPTFYMFNGKYKALTVNKLEGYFEGSFDMPVLKYSSDKLGNIEIKHPYFH